MAETGQENPLEKIRRRLFPTENEKRAVELRRSFDEALKLEDIKALHAIAKEFAAIEPDGAEAMMIIGATLGSINQKMLTANSNAAEVGSYLPISVSLLITASKLSPTNLEPLLKLSKKITKTISQILHDYALRPNRDSKTMDEMVTKAKEERGNVLSNIRAHGAHFPSPFGTQSFPSSFRIEILEDGLKIINDYIEGELKQTEEEFERFEKKGDLYNLSLLAQKFLQIINDKDSLVLQGLVRRGAEVMKTIAEGYFPLYQSSLANVITGATNFLELAAAFNCDRTEKFVIFKETARAFSAMAGSKKRSSNIVLTVGTVQTIGESKKRIGESIAAPWRTPWSSYYTEINEELKKCITALQSLETSLSVDPRKKELDKAIADKDLYNINRIKYEAMQMQSEEDKKLVLEAMKAGIALLSEFGKAPDSITFKLNLGFFIGVATEFCLRTVDGVSFDSELGKLFPSAFQALNDVIRGAERLQLASGSIDVFSSIDHHLRRFQQIYKERQSKPSAEPLWRIKEIIDALERAKNRLFPPPPPRASILEQMRKLDNAAVGTVEQKAKPATRIEIPYKPGEVIKMSDGGRFQVVSIHSGGQYIVYETMTEIGGVRKRVCLRTERKDIKPEDTMKAEQVILSMALVQRLRLDAPPEIARRLPEPHGVNFDEKGKWYLQLAWIDGVSLQEEMDQTATMTEDRVEEIVKKVAETLKFVSEKKVSHRDIKPPNIMVKTDGEIILIDFDIAVQLGDDGKIRNPDSRGTDMYAAREQFGPDGVTEITARTDIHALGVMIYEMLTGEGQTLNGGGFPLLTEDNPEARFPKIRTLSQKWQRIIENCTRHDQNKRWTAKQVLEALSEREPFAV